MCRAGTRYRSLPIARCWSCDSFAAWTSNSGSDKCDGIPLAPLAMSAIRHCTSATMLTRFAYLYFRGRGFRKLMESLSMWKAVFSVALLVVFSAQAEARPHHHHRNQHFRSAMALFVADWRRKNCWRSPFGMPPCVLWMRSIAVPLWQDYSSTKSRVQLAPFSENGTRNGYGGGSIGPRHDLATACRRQRLVCA